MTELIEFAVDRIQRQEGLPGINGDLAESIRGLSQAIASADDETFRAARVEDFIWMLEGVPAEHSLRAIIALLDSPHASLVRAFIDKTRASQTRVVYLDKLAALSELFTPARIARIGVTAKIIEEGWGWFSG